MVKADPDIAVPISSANERGRSWRNGRKSRRVRQVDSGRSPVPSARGDSRPRRSSKSSIARRVFEQGEHLVRGEAVLFCIDGDWPLRPKLHEVAGTKAVQPFTGRNPPLTVARLKRHALTDPPLQPSYARHSSRLEPVELSAIEASEPRIKRRWVRTQRIEPCSFNALVGASPRTEPRKNTNGSTGPRRWPSHWRCRPAGRMS